MDGAKSSPFPPVTEVPLQKNPPLAPSQELAYRNKCIQLKKRLSEIESNNDTTRRRISAERDRIHKQRLLRAILLTQLKDIMETPGRKFKAEELEKMGIVINGDDEDHLKLRPENEVLLDDSSDDSDEIPEPSDRPIRNKRTNNNHRGETIMTATAQPINPSIYQQPGLPVIAPANSYSPPAPRESLLTSSYQTPVASAISPQQYSAAQPHFVPESRYSSHSHGQPQSSPILVHTTQPQVPQQSPSRPTTSQGQIVPPEPTSNGSQHQHRLSVGATSTPHISQSQPQPQRPSPPYVQFCDHMRPQLEADNYPRDQIQARIDEEWRKLSGENRALWEERYNEQMREYEDSMDFWKRAQRRGEPPGSATGSVGRGAGYR